MDRSALLDTNVVLRLAVPAIVAAVETLRQSGVRLGVAPQSCVEAYVVATRPVQANGLGWTPRQAGELVSRIAATFDVQPDPPDLLLRWQRLVVEAGVRGVRAHDVRLAAYALAHGFEAIVTNNVRDFAAASSVLRVLRPGDVREMTEPGIPGA